MGVDDGDDALPFSLAPDPRWGRAQEVYSEDPLLSGTLAVAFITGMQGTYRNATPISSNYMLIAGCAKVWEKEDVF